MKSKLILWRHFVYNIEICIYVFCNSNITFKYFERKFISKFSIIWPAQIKIHILNNFLFHFTFFTDPPGAPFVEGYTQGETLRRGQNVELVCKSRGGNPPAQLIWYKNGVQVRMAYR